MGDAIGGEGENVPGAARLRQGPRTERFRALLADGRLTATVKKVAMDDRVGNWQACFDGLKEGERRFPLTGING